MTTIPEMQAELAKLNLFINKNYEIINKYKELQKDKISYNSRTMKEAYHNSQRAIIQNIEAKKRIKDLQREIINIIDNLYPKIKEDKLLKDFYFCEHYFSVYEFLYYHPYLIPEKENFQAILSYITKDTCHQFDNRLQIISSFAPSILVNKDFKYYLFSEKLCDFSLIFNSELLSQDKELLSLLKKSLEKRLKFTIFHSDIKLMKILLTKFPHISREFLLFPKKYLSEHIDEPKTLKYLSILRKMYRKDKEIFSGTLIKSIFDNENKLILSNSDINEELKILTLLHIEEKNKANNYIPPITNHCLEILKSNKWLTKTPFLITALLKANSTSNQDKLVSFLKIEEVYNAILQKDYFYYHFLIEQITEYDYGTIHAIFDLEEKDPLIIEKLKNYFSKCTTKYIYFYNEENATKISKTPISFYQQFIENLFSSSNNYLKECSNEYQQNNCFCNFDIILTFIDKNYISSAKKVLKFGIDRPLNYDINEEIYWNLLFNEIYYQENQEANDFDNPSYSLSLNRK